MSNHLFSLLRRQPSLSAAQNRTGRRKILKALVAVGALAPATRSLFAQVRARLTQGDLKAAATILGERLSDERAAVVEIALQRNLDDFQVVRDFRLDDLTEPAPMFIATRRDDAPRNAVMTSQNSANFTPRN